MFVRFTSYYLLVDQFVRVDVVTHMYWVDLLSLNLIKILLEFT